MIETSYHVYTTISMIETSYHVYTTVSMIVISYHLYTIVSMIETSYHVYTTVSMIEISYHVYTTISMIETKHDPDKINFCVKITNYVNVNEVGIKDWNEKANSNIWQNNQDALWRPGVQLHPIGQGQRPVPRVGLQNPRAPPLLD